MIAVVGIAAAGTLGADGTEARQQRPITFSADVAPIFYEHGIACHRQGEMGPMPLTSFREVRPWARAIRSAVVAMDMPPWANHADLQSRFSVSLVPSRLNASIRPVIRRPASARS